MIAAARSIRVEEAKRARKDGKCRQEEKFQKKELRPSKPKIRESTTETVKAEGGAAKAASTTIDKSEGRNLAEKLESLISEVAGRGRRRERRKWFQQVPKKVMR